LDKCPAWAQVFLDQFKLGQLGTVELLLAREASFARSRELIKDSREHRFSYRKLALFKEFIIGAVRLVRAAEVMNAVELSAKSNQGSSDALVVERMSQIGVLALMGNELFDEFPVRSNDEVPQMAVTAIVR